MAYYQGICSIRNCGKPCRKSFHQRIFCDDHQTRLEAKKPMSLLEGKDQWSDCCVDKETGQVGLCARAGCLSDRLEDGENVSGFCLIDRSYGHCFDSRRDYQSRHRNSQNKLRKIPSEFPLTLRKEDHEFDRETTRCGKCDARIGCCGISGENSSCCDCCCCFWMWCPSSCCCPDDLNCKICGKRRCHKCAPNDAVYRGEAVRICIQCEWTIKDQLKMVLCPSCNENLAPEKSRSTNHGQKPTAICSRCVFRKRQIGMLLRYKAGKKIGKAMELFAVQKLTLMFLFDDFAAFHASTSSSSSSSSFQQQVMSSNTAAAALVASSSTPSAAAAASAAAGGAGGGGGELVATFSAPDDENDEQEMKELRPKNSDTMSILLKHERERNQALLRQIDAMNSTKEQFEATVRTQKHEKEELRQKEAELLKENAELQKKLDVKVHEEVQVLQDQISLLQKQNQELQNILLLETEAKEKEKQQLKEPLSEEGENQKKKPSEKYHEDEGEGDEGEEEMKEKKNK